ncbi:CoA ester lyase [Mangrovicoccus sp. HB161399]|uniref:HpcH/HpaI aldolase/citrate lyase family protein n=1 Tax=Mangrovicoccus sp. HB161399 TaxID=2720392 RepID=UPI00155433A2|nr:CoA ester lyase [Mangrovicoccus sp. HB161399]
MIDTARSVLFVPGDRPERFAKAVATGADCVVLDLEDAVLADAKPAARQAVRDWFLGGGRGAIRVNAAETPWHAEDLALLSLPGVSAVLLPKAADPGEIARLRAAAPELPVAALVETARGICRASELAAVPGVARLLFGSVDYQNDTGIEDDGQGLLHARSALVVASAAAGLAGPVDGVTLALGDPGQLARDCAAARALGMAGKLCIHPRQVADVAAAFGPRPGEAEEARRIVAAADAEGAQGAFQLDGRLIDRPVVERARRLLARGNQREPA